MYTLSAAGLNALKNEEGFFDYVYDDKRKPTRPHKAGDVVCGTLTVGYGHALKRGDIYKPGVEYGLDVLVEQLRKDVAWAEALVNKLVKVPLVQHQFDALVSLAYNIPPAPSPHRKYGFSNSTLLRKLNAGDYAGAAAHFLDWRFSKGEPILLNRRKRERVMFSGPQLTRQIPDIPLPSLRTGLDAKPNNRAPRKPQTQSIVTELPLVSRSNTDQTMSAPVEITPVPEASAAKKTSKAKTSPQERLSLPPKAKP